MGWDQYLSEVLGVKQIVMPMPEVLAPAETHALETERILFLAEPPAEGESKLTQLEIFQKMLAAMKLEIGEFAVWELTALDLATEEKNIKNEMIIVCFSKGLCETLEQQRPKLTRIETHHPLECLKDPQLKKKVWEDLKQALAEAGLSGRL